MEKNRAYSVLELIGWGKYNRLIFIQCGLAWSTFNIWFVNIGYIIQGTTEEWDINTFQAGIIGSFFQFGLLLGCLLWGYIGNKYGRMKAFKNTALVASIGSVILTLSPNPFVVAGGLYVLGFGLAGEMAIGGIVFYEFCPPSKRYYITLLSLFLSIGSTSTTVIALLVSLLNSTPFYNWRIIVAVASALEILTMIFRFFMHETPAFLISQNKQSAANRLLSTISMINTGKSLDEPGDSASVNPNEFSKEIGNEDEEKDKEKLIVKKENPIAKLFKAPLKKVTFTIGAVYFLAAVGLSGYLYFMPEFLSEFSTSTAYMIIVVQQACGIPSSLINTWLVETRLGRRHSTLLSYFFSGLFIFIFGFNNDFWFVLIISSIAFIFVMSGYGSMMTIAPESFPTSSRMYGMTALTVCSRSGGMLSPIITGYLLEIPNGKLISFILFFVSFAVAGLLILLVKETKGKKSG